MPEPGACKKINVVVLDKTGTLTEGKPEVTNIKWLAGDENAIVAFASIENQSEHPLADSIVKFLDVKSFHPVHHFQSITGSGVKAYLNNVVYYAGNAALLKTNSISIYSALQLKQINGRPMQKQ